MNSTVLQFLPNSQSMELEGVITSKLNRLVRSVIVPTGHSSLTRVSGQLVEHIVNGVFTIATKKTFSYHCLQLTTAVTSQVLHNFII